MYVYAFIEPTDTPKKNERVKWMSGGASLLLTIVLKSTCNKDCLTMVRTFEVTYSGDRAGKKRKVFHDGYLTVQENPFRVSLLTEDRQKTVFTSGNSKDSPSISLGADITLGGYAVNISMEESAEIRPCTHTAIVTVRKKLKWREGCSAFQSSPPIKPPVGMKKSLAELLELDRGLQARMMPHQVAGAKFLIEKLYIHPEEADHSAPVAQEEHSPAADIRALSCPHHAPQRQCGDGTIPSRVAGAILADSMGLGVCF